MNKKILVLALMALSVCMIAPNVTFALSGRFNGLSVLYTVTNQTQVDALPSNINALGYDIAILVDEDGLVLDNFTVHDATQFGIAVDNRSSVEVTNCTIYNIGNHDGSTFDPNGAQYGLGIYYYASSGEISENNVTAYQKGGIIANLPYGDEMVCVLNNTVTGLGPVEFIAQNGIQIGWEAKSIVRGNTVSGNYYVDIDVPGKGKAIGQQTWVSCGILMYLVNPSETKVSKNKLFDNQVQFYVYPA
jgi:hypothetical protein